MFGFFYPPQVIVNGACSPIGKAAIRAITKARGMELGGAIDSIFVGMDAGEVWIKFLVAKSPIYLITIHNFQFNSPLSSNAIT
jgi:hypothetical protein